MAGNAIKLFLISKFANFSPRLPPLRLCVFDARRFEHVLTELAPFCEILDPLEEKRFINVQREP